MPSLSFVLPHWLYWSGLVVFPLVAMYLLARQRRDGPAREPTLFTAYLFWLTAGFMGLHRMYLRSWWGFAFIPLFAGVLYCNGQVREFRDDVSRTYAALEQADSAVERTKPRDAAAVTEDQRATYDKAVAEQKALKIEFDAAVAVQEHWRNLSRACGITLLVLLFIDAVLIPGIVRRQQGARSVAATVSAEAVVAQVHEAGVGQDPTLEFHTRLTDMIEAISVKVGQFVAYWGVIAVFVYYYEVLARFVFNSPTNWVHESMFLMFGMQYMLSGAYAYREDQHVRVDVLYAKFSPRGKAIADIVSSIFFFIFTLTMLWTGGRFAMDAIRNTEVSFTEWAIQYWPVKLAIPIGAALIVLQGIAKLIKDVLFVMRRES